MRVIRCGTAVVFRGHLERNKRKFHIWVMQIASFAACRMLRLHVRMSHCISSPVLGNVSSTLCRNSNFWFAKEVLCSIIRIKKIFSGFELAKTRSRLFNKVYYLRAVACIFYTKANRICVPVDSGSFDELTYPTVLCYSVQALYIYSNVVCQCALIAGLVHAHFSSRPSRFLLSPVLRFRCGNGFSHIFEVQFILFLHILGL